jgi:hypothetical protein
MPTKSTRSMAIWSLTIALGSRLRLRATGDLRRRAPDQQGRVADDHATGLGIEIEAQQAFIDRDRLGDETRQTDFTGRCREFGRTAEDVGVLVDFHFDMTGKRQLHLGELRERENVIGDIGGNEIADTCGDREGFAL